MIRRTLFVPREQYEMVVNELKQVLDALEEPYLISRKYDISMKARQTLAKADEMEYHFPSDFVD